MQEWIVETALFVNGVGSRDGGSCEGRDLVQAIQPMEDVNAMKDGKNPYAVLGLAMTENL
ncbi:hypothetical protein NEUTE1DRAFT_118146 [Neurospora tetrasperma FGSC 2508]|uniref:Uncharacterized protein n=1 Tax=Neurospora tetrasperma (strain FGSC 2508 / ATCC MYA-4615 / P0657) TaxID=510951 RepID=F8MX86_NEUT8|nr:uncharacterized protein NEUTE1DRAFT_118146 [Neurospora tetrasperma FGSC 2508]EGO54357.1 hypothetical protein NEUTE1DRAFT_118146 [Neurospora tetrasperma FGSC 2508]EGZ68203.1 hypothetical protein NEUTE2DRAFT_145887 [Neurospora tetrasperma FGSC 2509]